MIDSVFEISKSFMKDSKYVYVSEPFINHLVYKMLKEGKTKFPSKEKPILTNKLILQELVANSINYCYWYGKDSVRPNGAGATLMYELVEECFDKHHFGEALINNLIHMLTKNRFPLLEERIRHLKQLLSNGESYASLFFWGTTQDPDDKELIDYQTKLFNQLLEYFPGYASDIFLKRASLFFLQLHRKCGAFEQLISKIHVPADYQVPKLLEHFNCIGYSNLLKQKIKFSLPLQKTSLMECEIRAATIIACKKLAEKTGWNISDIDSWLWLRRKECKEPFHLCVTTDY